MADRMKEELNMEKFEIKEETGCVHEEILLFSSEEKEDDDVKIKMEKTQIKGKL